MMMRVVTQTSFVTMSPSRAPLEPAEKSSPKEKFEKKKHDKVAAVDVVIDTIDLVITLLASILLDQREMLIKKVTLLRVMKTEKKSQTQLMNQPRRQAKYLLVKKELLMLLVKRKDVNHVNLAREVNQSAQLKANKSMLIKLMDTIHKMKPRPTKEKEIIHRAVVVSIRILEETLEVAEVEDIIVTTITIKVTSTVNDPTSTRTKDLLLHWLVVKIEFLDSITTTVEAATTRDLTINRDLTTTTSIAVVAEAVVGVATGVAECQQDHNSSSLKCSTGPTTVADQVVITEAAAIEEVKEAAQVTHRTDDIRICRSSGIHRSILLNEK